MAKEKVVISDESSAAQLGVFFDYLRSNGRTSILIKAMEADYVIALEKNSPKKIRQLYKEMRELMRETFSAEQRFECDQLMLSRGVLKKEDFEELEVNALLEKNNISTREEFELLMAFVNENFQNRNAQNKVDLANKILHKFSSEKKQRESRSTGTV